MHIPYRSSITNFIKFYLYSFKGIPFTSWFILFTVLINSAGQMFLLFLSLYLNSCGFTVGLISTVVSLYNIGGLIGSYLGGYLAEKLAVKILLISLFSTSILLLLLPIIGNLYVKILIILCLGFSHSSFKPASIYSLINNSCKEDRARLIGLRRLMVNLGMSIASIIGGLLSIIGYKYIFWGESLFAIMAFLTLIMVSYKYKDAFKISHIENNIVSDDLRCYNGRSQLLLYIILFLNVLVFAQLFVTYPLYLNDYYNINGASFAKLFTMSCIIILLVEIPLLNYLKNKSQIKMIIIGSFLLGFGLLILPFSSSIILLYFSVISWTLGEIIFFPLLLNLIINHAKCKRQGRTIGIYQLIYSVGFLFGPIVGGTLYNINNANVLWFACMIPCAVSGAIFVLIWGSMSYNYRNRTKAN